MEKNVSDYDKFDYNYEDYWSGKDVNRVYEDKAERYVIDKLLPKPEPVSGWFCDLGGGFGRLMDLYQNRFGGVILSDYSLDSLKKAAAKYDQPNVFFVAANAYYLPFKKDSLDALLTVRLMHHIESIPDVFAEMSRVIKPDGKLLMEFSNKKHFVEVLRALAGKSKMKPFSLEPTKRGDLFYNFHPKYIKRELGENQFFVEKKYSASNFRSGIFKKIFPISLLLGIEKAFRSAFNIIDFGPSIFFLAKKGKDSKSKNSQSPLPPVTSYQLHDILVCPKCKSDSLMFLKTEVRCKECSKTYQIIDKVYDFRV